MAVETQASRCLLPRSSRSAALQQRGADVGAAGLGPSAVI